MLYLLAVLALIVIGIALLPTAVQVLCVALLGVLWVLRGVLIAVVVFVGSSFVAPGVLGLTGGLSIVCQRRRESRDLLGSDAGIRANRPAPGVPRVAAPGKHIRLTFALRMAVEEIWAQCRRIPDEVRVNEAAFAAAVREASGLQWNPRCERLTPSAPPRSLRSRVRVAGCSVRRTRPAERP